MAERRSILSSDKINLERIEFLMVDDNPQSLDIISSCISAFGVRNITKCLSAADARKKLALTTFDFMITDVQMPEETGYELLRWLRRDGPEQNRLVPAVVVTGHTKASEVQLARDCGAQFIVAKPVTPKILIERLFWVARDDRPFIECKSFAGPDRRFKRLGPPPGEDGRRQGDKTGDLGSSTAPNLSQAEINSLMKPAKVSL